jgi:ribosomal protein L19
MRLKISSTLSNPTENTSIEFSVGDKFQTLKSNNKLVYEIKKINQTNNGTVIVFDRGEGNKSTHTILQNKVIEYINKKRMIPIDKT